MTTDLLDDVRDGISLTLAPLNVDQYHQMIRDGNLCDGDPVELIQGTFVDKDRRDQTGGILTHGGRHLKTLNKLTALLSRWVSERLVFLQVQGPITLNDQSELEPVPRSMRRASPWKSRLVISASSRLLFKNCSPQQIRIDSTTHDH